MTHNKGKKGPNPFHKLGVDSHDAAVKDKRHRRRGPHESKDIHEDRGTMQTRLGKKHHRVTPR